MNLIVTEKHDAAQQIARLLSTVGNPKADKVYDTPIYRFTYHGDDCVCIGLRGHIMAPDFPVSMHFGPRKGWYATSQDGERLQSAAPDTLPRPPYDKKRKPYLSDGIDIKGWKLDSLPYLIWAPIEKLPSEKGIIRALKNLAKKASSIVIATDFDREGELIGSDALHQMQQVAPDIPVFRARYSAFTKQEIDTAFSHLVTLDQNLADAGESRQYIDLVWGAVLTRYLTMARFSGLGNVRSAGRVQTPTLALVVEKERERQAFIPKDYWVISATLHEGAEGAGAHADSDADKTVADADGSFKATHTTARFTNKSEADAVYAAVKDASCARITNREEKSRTTRSPAPFNTTSLQAAAAAEGLSPARTMRIAESLYMEGLISYPRVDNTVYPSSLNLRECVTMLKKVPQYRPYCEQLLAQPQLHATRGKQQTTDHPPIYPTAPADPQKLQPAAWKLYNLIARRFLATLSQQSVSLQTKLTIDINEQPFVATGVVLATPGFRAIYPFGLRKDDVLPNLQPGDVASVLAIQYDAKQTEPPARYSQGRLIQEMEKRGLGTKSTRASIIQRLYDVKYLKDDPACPSQLGCAVIDALSQYAPHITTPEMTAQLEEDMTNVAEGRDTQTSVVSHSRALLASMIDALIAHVDDVGEALKDAVTADAKVGVCPTCGKDLVMKNSPKTRSHFVGCLGWPDCSVTYPVPTGKIEALQGDAARCSVCGAPKVKVHPFRARAYEQCINPACASNQEPDLVVGTCSVCAPLNKPCKLIAHKSERTGKRFIRCENYEECQVSYPLPQRGELEATQDTCDACGAPEVIVHTQRGPWRICVNMNCPTKAAAASGARGRGRSASAKSAGSKAKSSKAAKSTGAAKTSKTTKTTHATKTTKTTKTTKAKTTRAKAVAADAVSVAGADSASTTTPLA